MFSCLLSQGMACPCLMDRCGPWALGVVGANGLYKRHHGMVLVVVVENKITTMPERCIFRCGVYLIRRWHERKNSAISYAYEPYSHAQSLGSSWL
jgi:hypothetical protein